MSPKISAAVFEDDAEKITRFIIAGIVALFHLVLLFCVVFKVDVSKIIPEMPPSIMKLADFEEYIPPAPPPPKNKPVVQNNVENTAQQILETEEKIETTPEAPSESSAAAAVNIQEEYLHQHKISVLPKFNDDELRSRIVYPPIAQRSGIEGSVTLELYIDREGVIRNIIVLKETPENMGFAEAAIKAFQGLRCKPAEANGKVVASRYRYPVRFKLN